MKKTPFFTLKTDSSLKEGNKIIYLKLQSQWVSDIVSGNKKSELRINDRDFKVGDLLYLQEIDDNQAFTGKILVVRITHMVQDIKYLQENYACLSIQYLKTLSN